MTYVAICLVSGTLGAVIASRRGSSFPIWFVISAVVPILGPIAALLYRREDEVSLRRCPGCGTAARVHDAICVRCGSELAFPDDSELIAPDASLRVRARL